MPASTALPLKDPELAVAPKKVNTWDKYKYKPELDVEISINENAKARNRPSRLGTGPKHDTKGLTGSAASRWAPKHVVEQALKQKQEEDKRSSEDEENKIISSPAPPYKTSGDDAPINAPSSAAQLPSASDNRLNPTAPTSDIPANATTPAQENAITPPSTSPQNRLDNLLTTIKSVNAERTSSSPEAALPSLLSRMTMPDDKPAPKQDDPWLIRSFSKPETSQSTTPSGGSTINWADEEEDDEEDLKALIGREWGAASLAKVEEKEQAKQVKPLTNQVPEPKRGVSLKGQATKATAPVASTSPNRGVELLPSQSPPRNKIASPRRVRPQVATQSDAFARLSRGFLGSEPVAPAPGGGARTRGKRAGRELLKEPGA